MMLDPKANWRNHKWYFDADYTETDSAPILAELIRRFGFVFDDVYKYILHGKAKQYIVRFPHLNGARDNPRVPTERRKDPFQRKLLVSSSGES